MGNGPVPVAPTKTRIPPDVLEGYFNSIEEPFHETSKGQAEEGRPIGAFIFLFIFCLIPLVPYLLSKLMFLLWGEKLISYRAIHFHLASFWFWWIVSFVLSLSLLVIVSKVSGPSKEEKKRWLSPQQMRFAHCYGTVDEIRKYRTNQLSRHIEKAMDYLEKSAKSLIGAAPLGLVEVVYAEQPVRREIMGTVDLRSASRPKWYRLRPETELILQAYNDFLPKLRDRLKDKKDLDALEAALTDLAGYQYTEIPELSGNQSQPAFEQVGEESLLSFAQQIVGLPSYRSEQQEQTPKEKFSQKLLSVGFKLSLPFTHENVLIAFCAWYLLLLLLFCGGFYLAFRLVPSMKADTTIIATLIGGPIATAVTAVTIPRLSKGKKQQD